MSAIGQNGPLIGQIADILTRLRATLAPWFPPPAQSPVLQSVLTGQADQFNFIYQTLKFAANQTRFKTASGGWLDLISWDFFAANLPRRPGELDGSFESRIVKEILRPRQTRAAIAQLVTDIVGTPPHLYESWNPGDNGGYGIQTAMGYGLAGAYGSLLFPNQIFVTTIEPSGNGIPFVAGYGSSFNGYGAVGGLGEYTSYANSQGIISLAEIYARISQVIAAGTIAWVDVVGAFAPPIIGPGMYPPWRIGGFDNRTNDVVVAAWVPPPPDPWQGNVEETQKRLLAPVIEAVRVDQPPIGGSMAQDPSILATILADWNAIVVDPPFVNGPQPYDSRDLPVIATQVTVNAPPYLTAGQLPTNIELAVDAWRPVDPPSIDALQISLHRLNPSIITVPVNPPPIQIGGYNVALYESLVDAWRAPDPAPFLGDAQPDQLRRLNPLLMRNNPPFGGTTPQTQMSILSAWTALDPTPLYWQPYAPQLLNPQLTNNPGQPAPLTHDQRNVISQQIANQAAQPPDPSPTLWPPASGGGQTPAW